MSMTADQVVTRLRADVPQFTESIAEHIADNDGLLLHLLLDDLARACMAAWKTGDAGFTGPALTLLAEALRHGDEYVSNAVSVSFVERVGPWDPAVRDFVASWPDVLFRDARRAGYPD